MSVYSALVARLSASSISISPLRLFAIEGDSRSTVAAWPASYVPASGAIGMTKAVASSTVAIMAARIANMQAVVAARVAGQKYYAVVGPMGANDLHNYPGATDAIAATAYAAAVAAYCDDLYAAGFEEVVLCTELPVTGATATAHNARRAIVNGIYTGSYPGTTPVTICDFAADALMGPDDSAAVNPTLWADALHPSAAGYSRLGSVVAKPVLDALP